jgi:hypothetical protein
LASFAQRGIDHLLALGACHEIATLLEVGLSAFHVAGLPCRQAEERLLAFIELDSRRQSAADRLDQVGLRLSRARLRLEAAAGMRRAPFGRS